MSKFGYDFRDFPWRKKLAGFFPGIRRETLNQKDIGIAQNIFGCIAEAETRLGKILQKRFQPTIPVFSLAQIGFRVEVDRTEQTAQFALVSLFYSIEDNIDEFADIVASPPLM